MMGSRDLGHWIKYTFTNSKATKKFSIKPFVIVLMSLYEARCLPDRSRDVNGKIGMKAVSFGMNMRILGHCAVRETHIDLEL